MKYIVRNELTKKVILETSQYKRAEDALFRTPEKSPENIVFIRARDGKKMFSLSVVGRSPKKK